MRFSGIFLCGILLALTACGSITGSDRPVYSGREESTAGVPGFSADGKRKLHPTIKLGQSYTVRGKTYVPRYQPDYDEEGLASWYGPGFHGGKTANGEKFSTHQHTAAHTTLPLPSIVRVTHLKNGRSTIVRINDRGPFAHGRIIDLSKAAAEDIGLIRDGVAKVRVQYMADESEKFAELLAQGRDPQSIDLASEVMGQSPASTQYADAPVIDERIEVVDAMPSPAAAAARPISVWDAINPISDAQAAIPASLPPAVSPAALPPASLPAPEVIATLPAPVLPAPVVQNLPAPATSTHGTYVQLGAFARPENAASMQQRFAQVGNTSIVPGNSAGTPVHRVRLGPFINDEAALEMLERARQMGVVDAKLVTEYH